MVPAGMLPGFFAGPARRTGMPERFAGRRNRRRSAEVWHALKGFSQFYQHTSFTYANGMKHAFAFSAEAGSHFTDYTEGRKAESVLTGPSVD